MTFDTWLLEEAGIQLIDGDRGKNYPGQSDFSNNGYCLFLSAKNVTINGFNFSEQIYISIEKDSMLRAGKLCRGDIVVTTRGTIGNIAFYDEIIPFENVRINSGMIIFRADEKLWNRRLLYFLLASEFLKQQIASLTSGSAVPQLPARDLKKFKLPKIPLAIQNKIADVIGSVTDKIELNRQINQTLEQIAQTIFKSWFVDFEPVKAKIEAKAAGRDPERAAMCAISGKLEPELDQLPPEQRQQLAATAALFPDELVESELGLIPDGWGWSSIGQEVTVVGGSTPSTKNSEFWNGEFAWVTPKDLSGLREKILVSSERKITTAGVNKISSGQLPVGAVLLSSRAPIGYLALSMIPVSINQGFIAMRCDKRLPNTYVLQWASTSLDAIKQRGSGTTFAEISKSNFRPMSVLVPGAVTLKVFQQHVMPLYEQIATNVCEVEAIAKLRDTLLPRLLSGDLLEKQH
jgi:type I restriction enzyme S subunit